jgi:hypothetical protein
MRPPKSFSCGDFSVEYKEHLQSINEREKIEVC